MPYFKAWDSPEWGARPTAFSRKGFFKVLLGQSRVLRFARESPTAPVKGTTIAAFGPSRNLDAIALSPDRAPIYCKMNALMPSKISVSQLNFYYGAKRALMGISMEIAAQQITALIGPSGCGKSTFLRCLNRMNDTIPGTRAEGQILLDGQDIYATGVNVADLRRRVGMVFQKPNPFPQSVYDNVAFGPRVLGLTASLAQRVERSLRSVGLWDELGGKLRESAQNLSLGQQQRLCIARVLATEPDVILMDEPCSALDPEATLRIEELIRELKARYTIVIVTHNMQQAARVSDDTGLFWLGELVEFNQTGKLFTRPTQELTDNYITGRMG
jgi:phosphate transport system ATP-binding protein